YTFYSSDSGGGGFFFLDFEFTNYAGVFYMGAAAEFARDYFLGGWIKNSVNRYGVGIFFAKDSDSAEIAGFLNWHYFFFDRQITGNPVIDQSFDCRNFFRCHFFIVGKIKTGPLLGNITPLLPDIFTKYLAERGIHQMSCGME